MFANSLRNIDRIIIGQTRSPVHELLLQNRVIKRIKPIPEFQPYSLDPVLIIIQPRVTNDVNHNPNVSYINETLYLNEKHLGPNKHSVVKSVL